jgi:hypothetical protein
MFGSGDAYIQYLVVPEAGPSIRQLKRPDSYQCGVLTHNPVAWARRAVVERIEQ